MLLKRFEDIEAWKLARQLNKMVYDLTKKKEFDDFGLQNQMRDAAGSVMHNIAEGFSSESNREFIRFLRYSKRSCSEIQSQLYVAIDLAYITQSQFETVYNQADRTRAVIAGFIRYLSNCKTSNYVREPVLEDEY